MKTLLVVCGLALGCSPSPSNNEPPPAVATPPTAACPGTHDADGPACVPRFDTCGESEVAKLGGGCTAVGVPRDRCGAGFVSDGRGGCTATLPKEPCAPGMIAFPGLAACEAIASCGSDPFGDVPDAAGTMHVDGSAAEGGEGSRGKPFRTIAEAIAAAPAGGVVAIAAGTYDEDVVIDKALRVVGRCPSMVTVRGVSAEDRGAAIRVTATATVERLAVTGPGAGVVVSGASSVVLSSLHVFGASTRLGVAFQRSAKNGVLRRSVVEDVSAHGVLISGSTARIENCLVRRVRDSDGLFSGVRVNLDPTTMEKAEGTVVGSLLEANEYAGAQVISSTMTIEGSVIRDSKPLEGEWGVGVIGSYLPSSMFGSTLTIRTSVIERNSYMGVLAKQAKVLIDRTVVRDTRLEEKDKNIGRGLVVQGISGPRAELTVRDSLFDGNHETGIDLNGDVNATIDGTIVRNTISTGKNGTGTFAEVLNNIAPALTITRSLYANNPYGGAVGTGKFSVTDSRFASNGTVGVLSRGAELTMKGTVIERVRPSRENGDGHGILAYPDAERADPAVTVEDSRIDGASKAGLAVFGGPARIVRSVVRNVVPEPSTDTAGVCVIVEREKHQIEPTTEIESSLLESCHGAGLVISGAAATVRSVHVRSVQPTDGGKFGDGIVLQGVLFTLVGPRTSRAEITGSVVEKASRAGVAVFGSELSLASTWLTCNPIALNVEPVGGFDGEKWIDHAFRVEDRGENACGCDGGGACVAQSTNLLPSPTRAR